MAARSLASVRALSTVCSGIPETHDEWLAVSDRQEPGRILRDAGEVAEWSKAPVLKTGESKGSVGSNPTLSAK